MARWLAAFALCVAAVVMAGALSPQAEAQGKLRRRRLYLAEAAMVLEGTRRTLLWAEKYPADAELARFAHPVAERYVESVGRMTPPKELRHVHPHLLLIVENVERALAAAAAENLRGFRKRTRVVREERRTLEGILRHLKIRLPELPR